jgi:hypothetical protein
MGIIKGSNYDNPYARPVSFDPFGDKVFEAFNEPERALAADEIKDDPWGEVKREFQQAIERQQQPRPRGKKPQDALMRETKEAATRYGGSA